MSKSIQLTLNQYTTEIKQCEKEVVSNFYKIGQMLKEVRDSGVYKQKYSDFEDYLDREEFQFSVRHGWRMISIVEEFSDSDVRKLGVTKCLELMALPIEKREKFIESKDIQDMSVRELHQEVQKEVAQIAEETGEQRQLANFNSTVNVSDKVDMLDKALSYLSEELDNVFEGLDSIKKKPGDYQQEYKSNKEYFSSTFKRIDSKLSEVGKKLSKARAMLSTLKKLRR